LEAARVDDEAYADALAKTLKSLACSGDSDAIYVVSGMLKRPYDGDSRIGRIEAAGAAATGLIDDLMNKGREDCSVSATLTDFDRTELLQIKQRDRGAVK
jgi:hypothetical protein